MGIFNSLKITNVRIKLSVHAYCMLSICIHKIDRRIKGRYLIPKKIKSHDLILNLPVFINRLTNEKSYET